MRGGQSHAHPAADQHHHDLRCAGLLGQKFGVAGKRNTRIVDDALVHGGGRHAGELAALATLQGTAQCGQHIAAICGIQHARPGRYHQRDMDHRQCAGPIRDG